MSFIQSEDGVAKQDIAKLIEIIKSCSALWNSKLLLGKSSDAIKTKLWKTVYIHFKGKYSITALQKSWKYLKEKYTRERKNAPSGSAAIKREWPHLRSLMFLDDVVLFEKSISDSITSEEMDINEPPRRKKKLSREDRIMSVLFKELKNSRPIPPTPAEPEQLNGDKDFCSYLASLMAGKPRNAKLKLQRKIINMVIEEIEDTV